jgi:response regulator RpfG family c-di-GMP phosphodiesterase
MNGKILIVDDNDTVRDLILMGLEADFDCDFIEAEDGLQAMEFLKNDPEIMFVISDYNMPNANGAKLYEFFEKEGYDFPFILFTAEDTDQYPEFARFNDEGRITEKLSKPDDFVNIPLKVAELIEKHQKGKSGADTWEPKCAHKDIDFVRVKIERLFKSNDAACDYFIRLSAKKYVKVINKDDLYDSDLLEKYMNKGLKYFYNSEEDFSRVSEETIKVLTRDLQNDNLSEADALTSQCEALDYIGSSVSRMGISSAALDLGKKVASSSMNVIKKSEKLTSILKSLQDKNQDAYDHGLLISYVASAICHHMQWNTPATLEKISLAAIFHDSKLSDNLVEIHLRGGNDFSDLEDSEEKLYKDHPIITAAELDKDESLPQGVAQIVEQHHEMPDGSGFPKKLQAQAITPMSSIFILAEAFVTELGSRDLTPEIFEEIETKFEELYKKGNFRKPYEGFIQAFKK